jgi:hypothetical protein
MITPENDERRGALDCSLKSIRPDISGLNAVDIKKTSVGAVLSSATTGSTKSLSARL